MKKNTALIGYTGFVGGNLALQNNFEFKYNSRNISNIENKSFDFVICAGTCAKKWWVNENQAKDKDNILKLIKYLKTIKCNTFILISTIDVYNDTVDVNENTKINVNNLDPYGSNRYYLEEFVKSNFSKSLIIRLPALYGKGLKKNFIYDLLNPLPQTIKSSNFSQIKILLNDKQFNSLNSAYTLDAYGNYSLDKNINIDIKSNLIEILRNINFTSTVFTDYRGLYQFYNLNNLSKDINKALQNNIPLLNLTVEPTYAYEISKECFNMEFSNIINGKNPPIYNFKSIYSELLDGSNGYIYDKSSVFEGIKSFANEEYNYEIKYF